MILSLLLALTLTALPSDSSGPWVPADTDASNQTCGIDAHRHVYFTDKYGRYTVNREKGEPDIIFDGKCHDNDDEHVVIPKDERKILPVPKKEKKL